MKLFDKTLLKVKKISRNNLYVNFLIILVIIFWQLNGLGKTNFRLLKSTDQQIQMLTSAKMYYFDYSSYEAAWNHHSPLIHSFYKIIYYIQNFDSVTYGEYLLYTCFLIFVGVSIFTLLKTLTKNIPLSFIAALAFIFDISSSTIGGKIFFDNRTLGIAFQSLILVICFKYINSKKYNYLIILSFVSTSLIYSLESYAASIGILFLYLFFNSEYKFNFVSFSVIGTFFAGVWITIHNYLNSDLRNLLDLNIFFHIESIGIANNYKDVPIPKILDNFFINGAELPFSGSIVTITLLLLITFYIFFVKKFVNLNSYEKLLIVFLLGELLHLFLTGPRFLQYSQTLLLPIYILFIISLFNICELIFSSKKISNLLVSLILLIIFFAYQYGDVVNYRTSLIDGTFQETIDSYKPETSEPQLVLTWIGIDKYESVFFENNSLPSTRLWWWHQMKYVDKFYDKNYKMFDDELLENVFIKDVKKERPKIAIIDTSIVSPPDYFLDYIDKNFSLSKIEGELKIYELNK